MQYIFALIIILFLIILGACFIIFSKLLGRKGYENRGQYDKRFSFLEKLGVYSHSDKKDTISRLKNNLFMYIWFWRIGGILYIVFAILISLIFFI